MRKSLDRIVGTVKGVGLGIGVLASPELSVKQFLKDCRKNHISKIAETWEVGWYLATATPIVLAVGYNIDKILESGETKSIEELTLYATGWMALQGAIHAYDRLRNRSQTPQQIQMPSRNYANHISQKASAVIQDTRMVTDIPYHEGFEESTKYLIPAIPKKRPASTPPNYMGGEVAHQSR